MRRSVFVLAAAVLVAACSSGTATTPPAATGSNATAASVQTPAVVASAAPTGSLTTGPTASPMDISGWIEVAPQGQGFGVAMPGKATTSSMTIAGVNAPTTIWTYTDESGRAFQVARSKFPKDALAGTSKDVLDNVARDLPSSVADGTVESQADVTISGHAGRRYLLVSPESNVEGVFVVAGDLVFTVYVTYEPGRADPGSLEAFLASFTLSV
jgi:hypothetical protein